MRSVLSKALITAAGMLIMEPILPVLGAPPATYGGTPASMAIQHKVEAALPYGMPLTFEANRGRGDSQVRFTARSRGYTLALTPTEAAFSVTTGRSSASTVRMTLLGANRKATMRPEGKQSTVLNYLVGNNKSNWQRGIPGYSRVVADKVYPGIDVVYYGHERQLEYDFRAGAHSNPDEIRLAFDGAKSVRVSKDGSLILATTAGEARWHRPVAYQDVSGHRNYVSAEYVVEKHAIPSSEGTQVRFKLGKYDSSRELVIDPTLSYYSILGGTGESQTNGMAIDSAGNVYITGYATSADFPTKNAQQSSFAHAYSMSFVAKMNLSATGNASLVYCTFLGGTTYPSSGDGATESGNAIAVDAEDNVYVTGVTESTNFPTVNGYASSLHRTSPTSTGYSDIYLSKLSSDGSALLYSTYFGGTSSDTVYGLALDSTGCAYLTGDTSSWDFPTTPGAYKASFHSGYYEAFVAKFNPAVSGTASLSYCTLVGAPSDLLGENSGRGVAVDTLGQAYVVGLSDSRVFPVVNGFQSAFGGYGWTSRGDGFLAKLNASGTGLLYSTYIGGSGDDCANAVAINSSGVATVVGFTSSPNFPVRNAVKSTLSTSQWTGFVTRIDTTAAGSASLLSSTYLGGNGPDIACSVCLDLSGNIYVGGYTEGSGFPFTSNHLSYHNGGYSNFIAELKPDASAITYCTYIGGSSVQDLPGGGFVAVDSTGNIYFAASLIDWNDSTLPFTANAYQQSTRTPDIQNAYVVKIAPDGLDLSLTESVAAPAGPVGSSFTYTLTVTNHGPSTSTNTVLTDLLSSSYDPDSPFTFTVTSTSASQGTVSYSGNTYTFNIGTLASGASATYTITLATGEFGFGTITSAGHVTSDQVDTVPANNSASATANVTLRNPSIVSVSPSAVAAGSPAFSLTVTGTNFASGAVVLWNGTPLSTTWVSTTQVTAAVPASLVAATGSASVIVSNPPPTGTTSNPAVVLIGSAALRGSAVLSTDSLGRIRAVITLTNGGVAPATAVQLTRAMLNGNLPTTVLPITVGTIAAGGSAVVTLTYPRTAGASGLTTTLQLGATYATGSYSGTLRVILP